MGFHNEALFAALESYYDGDSYRFEVPVGEFDAVHERLREAYYELEVVEDVAPYCVVKKQYTDHAEILRDSMVHWERRGYNFFLMEDELAVKAALEAGVTEFEAVDLALGL